MASASPASRSEEDGALAQRVQALEDEVAALRATVQRLCEQLGVAEH